MRRRIGALGALVAAMLLATAGPALADPARPSNYTSEVTDVTWEGDGPVPVVVEVVGGDSFLAVSVPAGVAVLVPGYSGEPYIRIDADGSVWLNRNSQAYYLNEDRYADVTPPQSAQPGAEPDWERAGSGGEWAWHDHRIHWMTPDIPPAVDESGGAQVAQTWTVPFEVDGTPVVVTGVLMWHPSQSGIPWALLVLAAAAAAFVIARGGVAAAGWTVAAAGAAALVVTWGQDAVNPPGVGGETVGLVAAGLATVAGVVGATVGSRRAALGDAPALVGAALLVVWALRRIAFLWLPVLPTVLPPVIDRAVVAVALGAGAGVVIVTFLRRMGVIAAPAVTR